MTKDFWFAAAMIAAMTALTLTYMCSHG